MKKVILGAMMMFSGMVSSAILMAGSMAQDWTLDGVHSFSWNLTSYGLMPILKVFVVIAVIGLVISIWGALEK